MKKSFLFALLFVGIAFLESFLIKDSISGWYLQLQKPPLNPPNVIFGPVWTVLYIFLGIFIGMFLDVPKNEKVIRLFRNQIILNFIWTPVFFMLHMSITALGIIFIMDILTIQMIREAYPLHKKLTLLLIPYLVWILFATYLNAGIVYFN